jgi:hypothetical protein
MAGLHSECHILLQAFPWLSGQGDAEFLTESKKNKEAEKEAKRDGHEREGEREIERELD